MTTAIRPADRGAGTFDSSVCTLVTQVRHARYYSPRSVRTELGRAVMRQIAHFAQLALSRPHTATPNPHAPPKISTTYRSVRPANPLRFTSPPPNSPARPTTRVHNIGTSAGAPSTRRCTQPSLATPNITTTAEAHSVTACTNPSRTPSQPHTQPSRVTHVPSTQPSPATHIPGTQLSPAPAPTPALSCSRSLHNSHNQVSTHSPGHPSRVRTGAGVTGSSGRASSGGSEATTTSSSGASSSAGGETSSSRTGAGTTPSYHRSGRGGAGTNTGSNAIPRPQLGTTIGGPANPSPRTSPASNPPAKIAGASNAPNRTTGRRRACVHRLLVTSRRYPRPPNPPPTACHGFTAAQSTHNQPHKTDRGRTSRAVPDFR